MWPETPFPQTLAEPAATRRAKLLAGRYKQTGRFPVIDQGQNPIAGWIDDQALVISDGLPYIVFGDHTRTFKFVDFPFVLGADGTQLLKPSSEFNPRFYYYACSNLDIPKRGYNRHFGLLRERNIPTPPRQIQEKIAAILRNVEKAVEVQEKLVRVTRELKAAAMRRLFTHGLRSEPQKETEIGAAPESWEIKDFASTREWLQYGTSMHCTVERKAYPVLRIPNVGMGHIDATDLKYCDMPQKEADKYILQDGDILFIRTNGVLERLGSCAVYEGNPARALFASYLIRARPKQGIDPKYMAYFYGSELGTALIAARATPAADGKYNLNTGTIDSLPLLLPATLEEQCEIVTILDVLDRTIALHEAKRTALQDLFQTLLHQLMTARIRVHDLDTDTSEVTG